MHGCATMRGQTATHYLILACGIWQRTKRYTLSKAEDWRLTKTKNPL